MGEILAHQNMDQHERFVRVTVQSMFTEYTVPFKSGQMYTVLVKYKYSYVLGWSIFKVSENTC